MAGIKPFINQKTSDRLASNFPQISPRYPITAAYKRDGLLILTFPRYAASWRFSTEIRYFRYKGRDILTQVIEIQLYIRFLERSDPKGH